MIKQFTTNSSIFVPLLIFCGSALAQTDEEKVKEVMWSYNQGIEALSADGLSDLFAEESQVFESGGSEGTFEHYLEHHLGPELKEFKSFKFSDYDIEVILDLPYAFTTETYNYAIILVKDERFIEQNGLATSILKKIDGQWKIIKTHTSARSKH